MFMASSPNPDDLLMAPSDLLVARTKQEHEDEYNLRRPPPMLYCLTTFPTLHRSVRTLSTRQRCTAGASRRAGTDGAVKQDRERARRRRRSKVEDYVRHNRLRLSFTLTYRDQDLPMDWKQVQRQLKAFLGRLRSSELARAWRAGPIPYLAVISRNGDNQRFHLHLALPSGFGLEVIQEAWRHGEVTFDGCYDDEHLGASAGYLLKNIEESAQFRPSKSKGYHVASGCQPPKETVVFESEAELEAVFRHDERISTNYYKPTKPDPWGTYEVRIDLPPPMDVRRGSAGLPSDLPAVPCAHGSRGCPACFPPKILLARAADRC